jgi:hypothetical protein
LVEVRVGCETGTGHFKGKAKQPLLNKSWNVQQKKSDDWLDAKTNIFFSFGVTPKKVAWYSLTSK